MKKLLTMLTACAAALLIAGCAAPAEDAHENSADTAAQTAPAEETSSSESDGFEEMTVGDVSWLADTDWVVNSSSAGTTLTFLSGSGSDSTVCAIVDLYPADNGKSIDELVTSQKEMKSQSDSIASDEWKDLGTTEKDGCTYVSYKETVALSDGEPTVYYDGYVAKDGICRISITSPDKAAFDTMFESVTIA